MKKTTRELEDVLLNTHSEYVDQVIESEKSNIFDLQFSNYFKDLLLQKSTVIRSYQEKSTQSKGTRY